MEENEKKEELTIRNGGAILVGLFFLMGYTIGRVSSSKNVVQSYKEGVSDTLNSIIFKHQ